MTRATPSGTPAITLELLSRRRRQQFDRRLDHGWPRAISTTWYGDRRRRHFTAGRKHTASTIALDRRHTGRVGVERPHA
jgi:hypothetical protein